MRARQEQLAGRPVPVDQPAFVQRIGQEDGVGTVDLGRQHPLDHVGNPLAGGVTLAGQNVQHDPAGDPRRFGAF